MTAGTRGGPRRRPRRRPTSARYEIRGAIQFRRGHKLRFSYTPLDYDANVPEVDAEPSPYGDTRFERFEQRGQQREGRLLHAPNTSGTS